MSIDVTDVLKENGILVTRWGRAREYVDFWKVLCVEGSYVSLIRLKNNRRPDKKGEEFAFLPIMDIREHEKRSLLCSFLQKMSLYVALCHPMSLFLNGL